MTAGSTPLRIINGLGEPVATAAHPHARPLKLDPRTYGRALDCVHCGLCLPACPTYTQNGLEADSPRGRIHLMKGLADGRVQATDTVRRHLDLCLDCMACETACPSGVVYHELIEEARHHLHEHQHVPPTDALLKWIFFHIFPHPGRLKLALLPVRILQKLGLWPMLTSPALLRWLPAQFRKMQQMLPADGPLWESVLAQRHRPTANTQPDGTPRARVALFAGCVGSVLFQHVNRRTIDLLCHLGCEVIVPTDQVCCGAIHHHGGDSDGARELAKQNLTAFLDGPAGRCDWIVNNIAGCGAALKDYGHLLRDDPQGERARQFVARTLDIHQLIQKLAPPPPTHAVEERVTYHHACHLAHAQRAGEPPLVLLARVPGLQLVPLVEADICCGAAGTYNLSQPEMATDLAERKIGHIRATGCDTCVTANVGCAMQIQSEANRLGVPLKVRHPVELLADAYLGDAASNR